MTSPVLPLSDLNRYAQDFVAQRIATVPASPRSRSSAPRSTPSGSSSTRGS